MSDYLSLKEAEQLAEEMAPFPRPSLVKVVAGMVLRPEETLRQAFAHPVMAYAHALAAVAGIYWTLHFVIAQAAARGSNPAAALGFSLVGGAALGVGYLYALTVLLVWSVDILGGEPHRKQLRMALSYCGIPVCAALFLVAIPKVAFFGTLLFKPGWAWVADSPAVAGLLLAGDAALFAWSLVLLVKALRLMNDFSTARAWAALLVPIAPLVLIGLLFWALMAIGGFFQPAQ